MNIQPLLPVLSQLAGRDVAPDVQLFYSSRAAIGKALNPQGQAFFIQNWRGIAIFLESPEGQKAIEVFMTAWAEALTPPAEPAPTEATA